MAEDKTVGIKVEVDSKQASKSLGDLENEFERLNEEIRKVPVNSKEFQDLNKQIAQTGREVKNLELSMESLDNEQVASELGSVAGAVGDVSAAFILLGDDSETMQEVAKNIEFAMGLSIGLKGAIEGVSSARKLLTNSTVAQNAVEKISNLVKGNGFVTNTAFAASEAARGTATVAATTATTASTGAMKLFRLALIGTGIGALIVGLGLLIANFEKVKDWVLSAADSMMSVFKPTIDVVVDSLQWLGIVESDAAEASRIAGDKKAQAAKKAAKEYIEAIEAEQDALELATDNSAKLIDAEIAKMAAAGKDTSELEKDKIELMIESTKKEIELSEKRNEARLKELEILAEFSPFLKDAALARIEELEGEKIVLEENLAGFELQLEVHEIKQAKIRRDAAAKNKTFAEEEFQEEYDRREANNIEFEEQAVKSLTKTNEELLQIYLDNQKKIDDKRIQDRKDNFNKTIKNSEELANSLVSLNNTVLEAQLQGAEGNAKKQDEIRRKSFKRNKALQLALANIDGVKAVLSTYANTVGGPVVKGIAAGLAGVTALANIKKIASSKYEGSGGGGSVPSGIGNTISGANGANVGQVTNTTTTIGEPTRVYVTEQDISSTQNKVSVNEAQATVG